MVMVPNGLPQQALYAVSRHSISDFFADRDAESRVSLEPLSVQNQTPLGGCTCAMFLHPYIVPPTADPD